MRIIAGNLRGTVLHLPKNKNTRPLKDMARESIFNLLIHSSKILFQIKNTDVLDVYAGTGSFGLECLSRQAKKVFFVENSREAIEILNKNIKKLKVVKKTKIFNKDIYALIENKNVFNLKFNLIFLDPPFKNTDLNKLIKLIYEKNLLAHNGIIILHRNKSSIDKLPNFFEAIDTRIYGISKIIFGKILS